MAVSEGFTFAILIHIINLSPGRSILIYIPKIVPEYTHSPALNFAHFFNLCQYGRWKILFICIFKKNLSELGDFCFKERICNSGGNKSKEQLGMLECWCSKVIQIQSFSRAPLVLRSSGEKH